MIKNLFVNIRKELFNRKTLYLFLIGFAAIFAYRDDFKSSFFLL